MKNLNQNYDKSVSLLDHSALFTFQNQYVVMHKETRTLSLWGDSTNDILNLQPLEPLLNNAKRHRVKNFTDPTSRSVLMIVVGEMYGKLFCVRKHLNKWEFGLYHEICEVWR